MPFQHRHRPCLVLVESRRIKVKVTVFCKVQELFRPDSLFYIYSMIDASTFCKK